MRQVDPSLGCWDLAWWPSLAGERYIQSGLVPDFSRAGYWVQCLLEASKAGAGDSHILLHPPWHGREGPAGVWSCGLGAIQHMKFCYTIGGH